MGGGGLNQGGGAGVAGTAAHSKLLKQRGWRAAPGLLGCVELLGPVTVLQCAAAWQSAAGRVVTCVPARAALHPQENHILLEKLISIKNFDSWSAFRPWLARSTFQYRPGTFYDPTTGAKCVDHLNPTAYLSPRSSHAPGRPSTAPTSWAATQRYLHTLEEVRGVGDGGAGAHNMLWCRC